MYFANISDDIGKIRRVSFAVSHMRVGQLKSRMCSYDITNLCYFNELYKNTTYKCTHVCKYARTHERTHTHTHTMPKHYFKQSPAVDEKSTVVSSALVYVEACVCAVLSVFHY